MTGPVSSPVAPHLSVIVPVHNEAGALREFLPALERSLRASFPGAFEIIVVDDASTDGTAALLSELPPGWIRLARHEFRQGSGAGRRTGSLLARGELCAWIDGDGTYLPEDLVAAAGKLETADQIVGVRDRDFGRWRFLRSAVKAAAAKVAGWLWRTDIPDLNSGLRIFRRTSLMRWIDEVPSGFSCTTTATLAALNHGQQLRFMPIAYRARARDSQSKFHPITDTCRLWRTIYRLKSGRQ